jgi:hypothetical protein
MPGEPSLASPARDHSRAPVKEIALTEQERPVQPAILKARRSLRPLKWLALGALVAFLCVGVALGTVAWQAARGSVSLAFFEGRIEAALRARLPPDAEVAIGSAAFSWRSGEGLLLKAEGVRLTLPGFASISAAELGTVTNIPAVLGRRIDLSSVVASGVVVGVSVPPRRDQEGSGADMIRRAASRLVSDVLAADELMRGAGLDEIVLRDSSIHMIDREGGASPALEIAEANWRPLAANRSKSWLQMVDAGGDGWDVTLEGGRDAMGAALLVVEVKDLPVGAIAPALVDDEGAHFDSRLALQARITAGPDGSLTSLRGVLSSGGGRLALTHHDEMRIAGLAVGLELGATGDTILVPNSEIRTEEGAIGFEGEVDLSDAAAVGLTGRVRGGELPSPLASAPVRIEGGELRAHVDVRSLSVNVERLQLTTAHGTISLIGQAGLGGPTPGLSLALTFGAMPIEVARAFWPPFVVSKTRRWVDMHVEAGTIGPATLQVALPPDHIGERGRGRILPSYALVGSAPIRDAVFSPLSSLPPVREATGEVAFSNATAHFRVDSGVLTVPGHGDLRGAGTTFDIPELGRPQNRGDLHLQLAGPAAALAALSDMPPLAVAAKRGIEANALSGEAELSLDAETPLFNAGFAKIAPTFRLALEDFSSSNPIEGRLISDADLILEGSPQSFTVTGKGTMDGIVASVDLILGSAAAGQSGVTLTLDEEARERLGLGLGGLVTGPVEAAIHTAENGNRNVMLDLARARISLPFLGWEKGAGVPATAHFVMAEREGAREITELVFAGNGFGAKGALTLGPDDKVRRLELTELALRPGDRLSLTATAAEHGYKVDVRGSSLDARGLVRGLGGGVGGQRSELLPLRISIDIESVSGQNDTRLSDISGTMRVTERGLDAVSLKGRVGAGGDFEWTVSRKGDDRAMRLAARDGGALLRFAGIYGKLEGGALAIDYSGPVGGSGGGVAFLRDFRVLGEAALSPAFDRELELGYDAAARGMPDLSSGDMSFAELRIPFRQKDWVITIDDAALRGASLGATGSGTINVPGGKLAISGTFIPAFGLNNIAGKIPIFGGILGGGRDEGLVGITYRLFGPLSAPELAVNPMSAIAPGIFRKIFEYR